MKKIGFDFDGVIIELPEDYEKISFLLKDESIFSNPFEQHISSLLITRIVNSDVWKEYVTKSKPTKGIGKLRKLCWNCEVYIISRRLESDRSIIEGWLKKHKIPVPSGRMLLRKNLSISPAEFKKSKVLENSLDEYWDDDEDIVAKVPNAKKFTGWKDIE